MDAGFRTCSSFRTHEDQDSVRSALLLLTTDLSLPPSAARSYYRIAWALACLPTFLFYGATLLLLVRYGHTHPHDLAHIVEPSQGKAKPRNPCYFCSYEGCILYRVYCEYTTSLRT